MQEYILWRLCSRCECCRGLLSPTAMIAGFCGWIGRDRQRYTAAPRPILFCSWPYAGEDRPLRAQTKSRYMLRSYEPFFCGFACVSNDARASDECQGSRVTVGRGLLTSAICCPPPFPSMGSICLKHKYQYSPSRNAIIVLSNTPENSPGGITKLDS